MQDNIERDSSELSKYTIFDNLRLLQAFNILCYNTYSIKFLKLLTTNALVFKNSINFFFCTNSYFFWAYSLCKILCFIF